jgi:hypothetical protein
MPWPDRRLALLLIPGCSPPRVRDFPGAEGIRLIPRPSSIGFAAWGLGPARSSRG